MRPSPRSLSGALAVLPHFFKGFSGFDHACRRLFRSQLMFSISFGSAYLWSLSVSLERLFLFFSICPPISNFPSLTLSLSGVCNRMASSAIRTPSHLPGIETGQPRSIDFVEDLYLLSLKRNSTCYLYGVAMPVILME